MRWRVQIAQRVAVALVTALLVAAAPSSVWGAPAEKESKVFIQVRSTKLRKDPSMIAPPVAELTYGEMLMGHGASVPGWISARDERGRQGFLHASAVTEKRVVMQGRNSKDTSASTSDVVLAGKGFNREIEGEFARAKRLDFGQVDAVERLRVGPGDVAAFVKAGQLSKR